MNIRHTMNPTSGIRMHVMFEMTCAHEQRDKIRVCADRIVERHEQISSSMVRRDRSHTRNVFEQGCDLCCLHAAFANDGNVDAKLPWDRV